MAILFSTILCQFQSVKVSRSGSGLVYSASQGKDATPWKFKAFRLPIYYDYYQKYLALKAGQCRHGGTLTQAVKQPYGVYFLTGQLIKGLQWGNINSIKTVSRNISKPLIPLHSPNPTICLNFQNHFFKFQNKIRAPFLLVGANMHILNLNIG